MIICITGTGTNVGKTIATAVLLAKAQKRFAHVNVVKPAQTGEKEGYGDLNTISQLTGITDTYEFARYPDPLAPLMAAHYSSLEPLNFETTMQQIRTIDEKEIDSLTLVEGAGGLLVDLGTTDSGHSWTIADLATALQSKICVVTSTGLGSLNHTELTLEALTTRGISCAGLIGGSIPTQPDLATTLNLAQFRNGMGRAAPWLGAIPAGVGTLSASMFTQKAQGWLSLPV